MTRFPHVGRFHFLRDETFHHCWIHICHISSHWLIWVWWNPCRAFDVSTSSVSINAMSHPGIVLPSGEFFFYSVTVVGVDDGSIPSMRHFHHHRCLPPKVSYQHSWATTVASTLASVPVSWRTPPITDHAPPQSPVSVPVSISWCNYTTESRKSEIKTLSKVIW